MHPIEMQDVSIDFIEAWKEAMKHLKIKGKGAIKWLKSDLTPPFLEHMSFRIGNQIFFIRLIDLDCSLNTPSNIEGLRMISKKANAIACYMPMRRKDFGWEVFLPDWGLVDAFNYQETNPFDLVTDENIIMTDWEIQDFAVQYCKNYVGDNLGLKICSSQGNPEVNPSIWFSDNDNIGAVIITSKRYGQDKSLSSNELKKIIKSINYIAHDIYTITVELCSPNQKNIDEILPLYRGHATELKFSDFKHVSEILKVTIAI